MDTSVENKKFDLGDRTLGFSQAIRNYLKTIPITIHNADDIKQLIRSSGSIGANFIEAEESLSPKDFLHRVKICRKEAKETLYWLQLLKFGNPASMKPIDILKDEVTQLMKIFGRIISDKDTKLK